MFELFSKKDQVKPKFSWGSKLLELILTALLAATLIELGHKYILNN